MEGRQLKALGNSLILIGSLLLSAHSQGIEFTLGIKGGYPVAPVPAHGPEAFLHFGDFSVGLSHLSGEYDISNDIDDNSSETLVNNVWARASMSMIEFRYFAFWGLNGRVGIGQRMMGLTFDIHESDNTSNLSGDLKALSIVVSHAFGLEWHFDWWYFSVEGVGYAYPLHTKTETKAETSGNISGNLGEVNEDLESAANQMGHVTSKQLFLLSFGLLL